MRERFETLAVKNASHPLGEFMRFVASGEFKAQGTVAQWMQRNHGKTVDTVQVQPYGTWAPMGRVIDAKAKNTQVVFNGDAGSTSGREYKGMTVLHADENRLVARYDFGGESWVAYQIKN